MNPLEVMEKFGIPVSVAMAFGFFIWKQNKYIQDDLTKDIHQKFNRLEGIIIQLIKEHYFLDIHISKYVIYNLYTKRGGSKLLQNLCKIEKA